MKNPNNNLKVIGIILTYDCASLVEGIYRRLPEGVFDSVIVVDDGSKDNIREVIVKLKIPFFAHEHRGYGGNIKYGLQKALEMGADYMVEIHGDGQYDAVFSKPGLEKIKQGYDFVLGSRFADFTQPLRDHMPLSRYLANIGLSFFDRLILGVPLTEFHTGFRIYSRHLLAVLDLQHTSDDYLFSFEIIAKARYCNLKIGEIPIRCDYSKEHTSIGIWKAAVYSLQTFYVLFAYALTRLGFPIRLFSCRMSSSL
jgi:glycosyltransferase involved in cell wall biosynthesis